MTEQPVSVIIPAHNEATVISRCLAALTSGAEGPSMQVIVVCNGCTDETAALARRFSGVEVLELVEASKTAALNAGDARARHFPRFYVDADVEISRSSVASVSRLLDAGDVLCAAPSIVHVSEDRPWVIRSFYRVWRQLPYLTSNAVGNGVYALSAEGRRRFDEFPSVTADDLFVYRLFAESERAADPASTFRVFCPTTVSGLLAVRTRTYRGNSELARDGIERSARPHPLVALSKVARRSPGDLIASCVYLGVNVVAMAVSRWRSRTNAVTWERDESSRQAASSLPVTRGRAGVAK